ncbi:MAG: bifunctional hydroxymethylpyrimidine kinase/phosphomethylpyrimidine kinase [Thermanaeromonas sp.]|uniref:bifunctional hydroxymethylpyrimidine kinase/phosphomethylpyrimidine kinase n=1 Tax=Thermanaeromonas sp. TaxID=2003697 RepID=UPI00243FD002|nr:bifunctional hydroxymethylpyrimidine kinase/phosphomethylpyrimidine kinase [Thermanaeromonas sp.]MCG0276963.1 bifunctional hydroxymethylpyrimidine kinase/phosphomethylpyrimidine kinase [Thermanaeromonas sp.]
MYKALTIAGSDSGGGAGLQADLKTFAALKVYGTSVVTSVTAQNTLGVQGSYDLPADFVARQLDSVLGDIGADAVKTGMLANAEIVSTVAAKLKEYGVTRLVVDPVMVAKSGHFLLTPEAREVLKKELFPLALVVTPNIDEAEALTGLSIQSEKDMVEAARQIREWGPKFVVVKGGHLAGEEALDILFDGKEVLRFSSPRLTTSSIHGTGCTFAAAITAFLARGWEVPEAVEKAKEYVRQAMLAGRPVGAGYGCLHHLAPYYSWEDN